MLIKKWSIVAAMAIAVLSPAQAQNLENLLMGIATDIIRGAVQQQQPAAPANVPANAPADAAINTPIDAAQARQILIEMGYAFRDAGSRTIEAPVRGFWLHGNPNRHQVPVLISQDGRFVVRLLEHETLVLERLPGSQVRSLSPDESRGLLQNMLANLRPEALIPFGAADHRTPILLTAANCPACIELDHMVRPMTDLQMRVAPTLISRNADGGSMTYSRIMCNRPQRQSFERSIDARGRNLPPNVPGCDLRLEYWFLSELLWATSGMPGDRRYFPVLFSAHGGIVELDRRSAATVRASIRRATIQP